MYLSHEEILYLIANGAPPLVEGVEPYQLLSPDEDPSGVAEGPCVEMRIGNVYAHERTGVPVLAYDLRSTADGGEKVVRFLPSATLLLGISNNGWLGQSFSLGKGESVLVESVERIQLPNRSDLSLMCVVEPRFSLARMGVAVMKSDADPGYSGPIVIRITNSGPFDRVELALGARIAKLRFVRVGGKSPSYVGRYGGKVGDILERR